MINMLNLTSLHNVKLGEHYRRAPKVISESCKFRDSTVSERFTAFTYICIMYCLCVVFVHKDR